MADEWTIDILKKWKFSSYEAIFKEQEIDKDSFLKLSDEHIRLLIPRLGPQVKFLNLWKNLASSLQKIENVEIPEETRIIDTIDTIDDNGTFVIENILFENISEEKEPIDESSTDPLLSIQVEESQQVKRTEDSCHEIRKHTCISNNVKRYLERTSDGKSYFGIYNKHGFDNALRTDLAKYIIAAELADDPNKRITSDDFRRFSLQIVQLFPMEIAVSFI
ncbi:PREDICTED: uncharacterized protein LOC105449515 [Wasmannia auropunctata]|uniref:uncharacterized protein LOC105449515 n=1 Tax=Wasmannia auropunctata TaxID=64793 RepID=UPI0005F0B88F|nr:PREDICTED: uncharacterized protein LOC105449515 [Wasmannia auropunctata]